MPYLCGGHTTLNGDIEGNTTPDVTLDGTGLPFVDVLRMVSDHNAIKNLRVTNAGAAITITLPVVLSTHVLTQASHNTIEHNEIIQSR